MNPEKQSSIQGSPQTFDQNLQQFTYNQQPQQYQQQQQQQMVQGYGFQNISQGIPTQQYQQPVYMQNQAPLQQSQIQVQMMYPNQNQPIQQYSAHNDYIRHGNFAILTVDQETIKQAQLRELAIRFKKMNECWAICILILLLIYIMKLIFSDVSGKSYIGIVFVIIEYILWAIASLDGKYSMEKQQFNRLLRMAKLIYVSVPFQILGHGLLLTDDIQNGFMILIILQIVIEIYIVYYKIAKLARYSVEIKRNIDLYNEDARQKGNPTAEQILALTFNPAQNYQQQQPNLNQV